MSLSKTALSRLLGSASLVAFVTIFTVTDAAAQDAIETITVTARMRDEPLQSVPEAVSVFTARDLESARVQTVEDLANLTPGFSFAPLFGGGQSTPVIRGLSTTIGEANVGFFIDGVYQSSRTIMDAFLGDGIERVEIVKGPQSALYGRNTFGGAINYITARPSNDLHAKIQGTLGNYGDKEFRGSVSGALIKDKLLARLNYTHINKDGYFRNRLTGGKIGSRKSNIVAGTLEALPASNVDIVLRLAYDATRDGDSAQAFIANNAVLANPTRSPAFPAAFQVFRTAMPDVRNNLAMTPGHQNHDYFTGSLSVDWTFNDVKLTSITGYNDLRINNAIDDDYELRNLHYLKSKVHSHEFGQELRLSSTGSGPFSWLGGLYYYNFQSDTVTDSRYVGDPTVFGTPASYAYFAAANGLGSIMSPGLIAAPHESTESFAAFGQLAYSITDALRVTAEGRWTREKKSINETDTDVRTLVPATYTNKATFDSFLPRFTVDYHVNEDVMIYGIAAKALKAGGFNFATVGSPVLPSERTYKPESAWNYELGAKTTFANGTMQFNIDGFYIDWKNQIVRAVGKLGALLNVNAGKTTSKGIEAELRAQPIDGLDLRAGFAYTDTKYDNYTFGILGLIGENPDLSGNTLQYVSKYTFTGTAQYTAPVTDTLNWVTRIDLSYRSKQYTVQTDDSVVGPATLVNFRTGIESEHYSLRFWMNNVFNEKTALTGVYLPSFGSRYDTIAGLLGGPKKGFVLFNGLVTPRDPRTFGITASYKF